MATKKPTKKAPPKKAATKPAPSKAANGKKPASKASKKKKEEVASPVSAAQLESLLQSQDVQDQLPEQYKGLKLDDIVSQIEEQHKNMAASGGTVTAQMKEQISAGKAFDLCAVYHKAQIYIVLGAAILKLAFKKNSAAITDAIKELTDILDVMCAPVASAIAGGESTGAGEPLAATFPGQPG